MNSRSLLTLSLIIAALGMLVGCTGTITNLFSPDFLSALGTGSSVASLPGEAPGLLVEVENRTDRWMQAVVSYRDGNDNVESFTTLVAPRDKTGQMVVCPITEITLGDVSNLSSTGARIFLIDVTGAVDPDTAPFIEVDAFGALLQEEINYNCGDALTFAVSESTATSSGYRIFAFIRRSAAS